MQAQIRLPELTGDFRVGWIGYERLPERRQRFLEIVAGQLLQTLLSKWLSFGRVAGFRSSQVFHLFPKGLHADCVAGVCLGDHLLDVIVDGFVLACRVDRSGESQRDHRR